MDIDTLDLEKQLSAYKNIREALQKEEAKNRAEYDSIQHTMKSPLCPVSYGMQLDEMGKDLLKEIGLIAEDRELVGAKLEKIAGEMNKLHGNAA